MKEKINKTFDPVMFDKPRFHLVMDTCPRMYATVDNLLEVSRKGKTFHVPVEVNTGLFQLMASLGVPKQHTVRMFLEEYRRKFLFGFEVDNEHVYDLWLYTQGEVPPIILRGGK